MLITSVNTGSLILIRTSEFMTQYLRPRVLMSRNHTQSTPGSRALWSSLPVTRAVSDWELIRFTWGTHTSCWVFWLLYHGLGWDSSSLLDISHFLECWSGFYTWQLSRVSRAKAEVCWAIETQAWNFYGVCLAASQCPKQLQVHFCLESMTNRCHLLWEHLWEATFWDIFVIYCVYQTTL